MKMSIKYLCGLADDAAAGCLANASSGVPPHVLRYLQPILMTLTLEGRPWLLGLR